MKTWASQEIDKNLNRRRNFIHSSSYVFFSKSIKKCSVPCLMFNFTGFGDELTGDTLIELIDALKFCVSSLFTLFGYDGGDVTCCCACQTKYRKKSYDFLCPFSRIRLSIIFHAKKSWHSIIRYIFSTLTSLEFGLMVHCVCCCGTA